MGRKDWEREKLLVMSIFSFSHIVFKRLVLQTCENQGLLGKEFSLAVFMKKLQGSVIARGSYNIFTLCNISGIMDDINFKIRKVAYFKKIEAFTCKKGAGNY